MKPRDGRQIPNGKQQLLCFFVASELQSPYFLRYRPEWTQISGETLMSDLDPRERALIDQIADRFEKAWRDGRPRIEDFMRQIEPFLAEVQSPPERSKLLKKALFEELFEVELDILRERGETLAVDDYHRRFPAHADYIDDLIGFPSAGPENAPPPHPLE